MIGGITVTKKDREIGGSTLVALGKDSVVVALGSVYHVDPDASEPLNKFSGRTIVVDTPEPLKSTDCSVDID